MIGEVLPRGLYAPSMMVTTRMPHFLDPVIIGTGRKLSFKQTDNGTVVGGGILGVPYPDQDIADTVAERLRVSAQTCCILFPIMRRATIARTWAGLEARMPDEIPVRAGLHRICGMHLVLRPWVPARPDRRFVVGRSDR